MIIVYFYSDESNGNLIEDRLVQLRCHFTWKLQIKDAEVPDLENRVFDEIDFLDTKFNVAIHNLQAYVKHLTGQNKEALQSLQAAEDLVQTEHARQSDVRRLVTWGNYAWLYYHMGRLAEAQIYLDKVENTCKQLASPSCYTVESPEMDCEEGWALLKCGGKNYERAKACFEKALGVDPENPEFNTGYAIAVYRLEGFNTAPQTDKTFCLHILKRAIRLNPEDAYMKALLALTFQDIGQEAEGEKYIEEALSSKSSQTYVLRYAAKFYRRKGSVDKALQFLNAALRATPSSALLHHQVGLCYKTQMIQIKNDTNWQHRGQDKENIHRLVQKAVCKFETALKIRPTFHTASIDLAEMHAELGHHREAEDTFQKLLGMGVFDDNNLQQWIHFRYGRFQEFHRKSEDNAVIHYLKAINIDGSSITKNRSLSALEKLVLRKLRRNAADIESLSILGFVYKLNGEMNKALEYYEQALRLAAGFENSVGHVP
ncbi:interferon-induced protein with tetratricopeptide repeats 1B-like [Pteronotus mesoamericanus]|uniref:interferon-induced protein with tetratricopeptide repeats 1B-like n=1 Tax=Pteronotus mesoamericanus TaxID=1884717 RepID=UPI0023EC78BA|nr:interferon-induced protein with tetratricopeptide repeats 1B-like [Pteronotus parnellii mesoamericanus]